MPVMVDANADEHVDAVKNPPVKSALNQVSVRELAQTKARLVDEATQKLGHTNWQLISKC